MARGDGPGWGRRVTVVYEPGMMLIAQAFPVGVYAP